MRKVLNRSSCQDCVNKLIDNVREDNSSSFVLLMDFTGNSLIEPSENLMKFFNLLLSVYVHHKPKIKALSITQNVLKILCTSSIEVLKKNNFSLPFCCEHFHSYTKLMVQATMKTFLKAYIHEMNETNRIQASPTVNKTRKLNIFQTT